MANIIVTTSTPNVIVNSTSNVVTVTNTTSNIIVGESNQTELSVIRSAFSTQKLAGTGDLTYSSANGVFSYTGDTDGDKDNWLASRSTSNVTEGVNLYYTNERVRDTIGNTLVGGSNITITPDDANNIVTISADLTGDITGVTAGSGLTGGGTTGDVTLNVGAGTGITVNADNVAVDMSAFSTSDLSEGTNLYYTNARVNAYVIDAGLDFNAEKVDDRVANLMQTSGNLSYTYDDANGTLTLSQSLTTTDITEGDNLYWTTDRGNTTIGAYTGNLLNINTITASGNINGGPLYITGDSTIIGNLEVQGNIDYVNVEDLLVNDNSITLNYGNATPRDAFIYVDRSGNISLTNAHIKWNETDDDWEFFDGTTTYNMPKSTTDLAEGTNLYYTDARVNTAIQANVTGAYGITFGADNSISVTNSEIQAQANIAIGNNTTDNLTEGSTNLYFTNARANAAFVDSLDNISVPIVSTANITTTANVEGSWFVGNIDGTTANLTNITVVDMVVTGNVTSNANIDGNLYVGGTVFATAFDGDGSDLTSVRAETVEEKVINKSGGLLAKGTPVFATGNVTADVLWVDACDASNAATMPCIGVLATDLANDTEGRAIISGRISGVDTSSFAAGDEIYVAPGGGYTNSHPTGEANIIQFLGIVTESSNTGGGIVNIESPHDESNLDEGNIFLGDTNNMTRSVTPDTNFDTTGNVFSLSNALVDVNKIDSETDTAFTLYGEGGIEFNKKVDSTESRIVDITTTGYSLSTATLPADFDTGTKQPSMLISVALTANSNTATALDLASNGFAPFGLQMAALRGPNFSQITYGGATDVVMTANVGAAFLANVEAAFTTTASNLDYPFAPFFFDIEYNGISNATAGLYGQDKGWRVYDLTSAGYTTAFPANTYVTGMSGSTITFSNPALISQTPRTLILQPAMAQTSGSNVLLKYQGNVGVGSNNEFRGIYGALSTFDQPETLSNTTFDAVSYGNTTSVTMTSVGTKNISDFVGSDESATRFKRGLLVGASTTPDPGSSRSSVSDSSTLGVILENDGETYTGNGAPAPRFILNNYTGNFDNLSIYPTWASLGATGNLTLDLPQVKANQLLFKAFRGKKSNTNQSTFKLAAGEVVGKIAFAPAQTDGTGYQGIDYYNPPAAITVDVGNANIGYVANTYMHITTTPDPGTNLGYMRNNANTDFGANQQTNFTTKGGNVTIAAKADGRISLAPTPDYADLSNSTVWTRYPGATHDRHRFLDVSYEDSANRTGSLLSIQPISGNTTNLPGPVGGGGSMFYNSLGNATIRFNLPSPTGSFSKSWDITANADPSDAANLEIHFRAAPGNVSTFPHVKFGSNGETYMKKGNVSTTLFVDEGITSNGNIRLEAPGGYVRLADGFFDTGYEYNVSRPGGGYNVSNGDVVVTHYLALDYGAAIKSTHKDVSILSNTLITGNLKLFTANSNVEAINTTGHILAGNVVANTSITAQGNISANNIHSNNIVNFKYLSLGPGYTNAQILAFASPANGDMVWGQSINKFVYFDGTNWVTIDNNTVIV